jgi:lipopolysaccharide transport system ATP-binding protein
MNDTVIRANSVGKEYLIGHVSGRRDGYTALRDVIGKSLTGLARSARQIAKGQDIVAGDVIENFWALENVSFDIKRGEVVGIIGRNGAGKSTLLKILSRITEPSSGRIELKGRVASLLEVGTGFHPELTGRENVYLNGAILGMSRAEIRQKFDEIVAFAEVEKFLDTPVKRYSSGMYVRLAFAVAAHLEPDILIVDEVLAVGDFEFQKKCLGKLENLSTDSRTVLLVSHNMAAISRMCSKVILLEKGRIASIGSAQAAIDLYYQKGTAHSELTILHHDKVTLLEEVFLVDEDGCRGSTFIVGQAFGIRCRFQVLETGYNPAPTFLITASDGTKVFHAISTSNYRRPTEYQATAWFTPNLLNEGFYSINFALTTANPTTIHAQAELTFNLDASPDMAHRGDYAGVMHGVVRLPLEWR